MVDVKLVILDHVTSELSEWVKTHPGYQLEALTSSPYAVLLTLRGSTQMMASLFMSDVVIVSVYASERLRRVNDVISKFDYFDVQVDKLAALMVEGL